MPHLPGRQALALAALLLSACAPVAQKNVPSAATDSKEAMTEDRYLWLEDIHGEKPLQWVERENAVTHGAFADTPEFGTLRQRLLEVLDSDAKIPYVSKIGAHYYNLWRNQAHPRGLWRRTTLAEYRKDQPAWETVLDLDALGRAEGKAWVWKGAQCLAPEYRRCLLSLSPGGGDAVVVREFDLADKGFVKGGFELPEAKTEIAWIDADHIYVATDFGPGSMTKSSYPRIAKEWKRGTPLPTATMVHEVGDDDLGVSAFRDLTPGFQRDFVVRSIDFYTSETFVRGKDGTLAKIDVPLDARVEPHREWMLIEPRSAWTVGGRDHAAGSLLAIRFDDFIAGKRELTVLFQPSETTSLAGHSWTRHHLVVNALDDVASRLEVLTPPEGNGEWKREPLGGAPALSSIEASGVDADESDDYFLTVSGFLTPTTLYHGTLGHGDAQPLKRTPEFFDASKDEVKQHFAQSKDGTRVPYFVIAPKDMALDGRNPTLLYGYGGFEVSLLPAYNAVAGRAWLERGGVYVIANIRGGGEYGPRWHQAALKEHRHRAYEDFAAVAEDLVKRGITSRAHLGAQGGSNGGLLVGNMLTQYPEHFGAIVCEVPLLDMKRYTKLSAGTSWIAEYGDPDKPEEWAFIQTFSPYENAKAGKDYPATLFYTATSDDRVGPVQARKMAAKLKEQLGYSDVWLYENREGGHGGAADNRQAAFMRALSYSFLWNRLAQAKP